MEIVFIYPVTNIVDPLLYDFKIVGGINYSVEQHIIGKQVDGIAITFSCLYRVIDVYKEQ